MAMKEIRKLTLMIEWVDGAFGGQVKAPGFLFITQGNSVDTVIDNLRDLIADYLENEGKEAIQWQGIEVADLEFEFKYKLEAFFAHFRELKITAIAHRAGMNPNLLQQYVSGNKYASQNQAKKIESAIHQLANELRHIALA
jgi:hypothetical protein